MKRVLVLSDSHGNVNNMILAVRREMPEMIIHLGDCWADAEQLQKNVWGFRLNRCRETVTVGRNFWKEFC